MEHSQYKRLMTATPRGVAWRSPRDTRPNCYSAGDILKIGGILSPRSHPDSRAVQREVIWELWIEVRCSGSLKWATMRQCRYLVQESVDVDSKWTASVELVDQSVMVDAHGKRNGYPQVDVNVAEGHEKGRWWVHLVRLVWETTMGPWWSIVVYSEPKKTAL